MYDSVVVGAGPAGGMAARHLAAAGFRTLLLDKKKVVGEPVQCAEGVSRFALESNGLRARPEWICQEVRGARAVAPGGASFFITRLPGYALDRAAFDRGIAEEAVDRGADLRASTRVTGIERRDGGWRVWAGSDAFDARAVVAADGPTSLLARSLGLVRGQDLIRAYEYRFRAEDVPGLDADHFLLYVARRYEGGYAWIFPRGDEVNVGAGGHIDAHAATQAFCRERGIDPSRRRTVLAGTIPYRFDFRALALPGFAVAGDAAGVSNPMNGAGIHAALFSGRLAGEFAALALDREDPGAVLGYDRAIQASPFLDPLLFWMIERVRRWNDRLLDAAAGALDGGHWRDVNGRLALRTLVRKPWMGLHSREFYRMIRALELCERYGW